MEFNQLMELASQQTKASQLALAKETQLRQQREKKKRLEEERKERERMRLEKERLSRLKREDEKREERLKEERRRRETERKELERERLEELKRDHQTHPSSTHQARPFTQSRVQQTSTQRSKKKRMIKAPQSSLNQDPEEVRRLEREEKMARARARLFDEPVSVHKKSMSNKSNNRSLAPSASTSKLNLTQTKVKKTNTPSRLLSQPNLHSNPSPISTRERLQKEFSINERKALNTVKRDRRTIEEIERDMKARRSDSKLKQTDATYFFNSSASRAPVIVKKLGGRAIDRVHSSHSNSNPHSESISGKRKSSLSYSTSNSNHTKPDPKRFRRNEPEEEEEEESDSFVEDDDEEEEEEVGNHVPSNVRDQIWKIMGKDRSQYTNRDIFSDEEESDGMEVRAEKVLEEESKAAALARKEDLREQEILKQHELEKKKRLGRIRSLK
ncbi:SPT2 chromatin protein-domain-containing protein [Melampsora americana]|nr:SPT2 chromatin protein-domain-containing protein [Melampsora americana]